MTAMIHLDSALWPDKGSDLDDRVKVKFADAAASDISTMSSALQLLESAQSASTETRVQMLHPDWTMKQVAEEVKRLKLNEQIELMDKGILSKPEVRASYMNETPEQAKKALEEINAEAMQQQAEIMQMSAAIQTQAQAQQEAIKNGNSESGQQGQ